MDYRKILIYRRTLQSGAVEWISEPGALPWSCFVALRTFACAPATLQKFFALVAPSLFVRSAWQDFAELKSRVCPVPWVKAGTLATWTLSLPNLDLGGLKWPQRPQCGQAWWSTTLKMLADSCLRKSILLPNTALQSGEMLVVSYWIGEPS